jgi:hypothetical protein
MNKTNKKNGSRPYFRYILMALSLLLIVWSLWPPATDRQTLAVNPGFIQGLDVQECPALNQLLDYEFELVAPHTLWKAQNSTVLLTVRRISDAGSAGEILSNSDETCTLALETHIAVNNLRSEPGNVIIQPFVGADRQSFVFTISPLGSGTLSGKLWVYADLHDALTGADQSLPLFSIPLKMQVWTIFGQPPVLVRYVSLLALLILLAFEMRRHLLMGQK